MGEDHGCCMVLEANLNDLSGENGSPVYSSFLHLFDSDQFVLAIESENAENFVPLCPNKSLEVCDDSLGRIKSFASQPAGRVVIIVQPRNNGDQDGGMAPIPSTRKRFWIGASNIEDRLHPNSFKRRLASVLLLGPGTTTVR